MPRSGPATWSWATAKVWPSFRRISPMRSLTRLSEMTAFEDFVTEEVGKGRSIPGLYPATDEKARSDFAA